ncbi:unnamed protein product [Ectocarpus sp. CCAP 1310/34]|nr:unnamed protein product [Ectocarpus sp. CCAP 1310/34]
MEFAKAVATQLPQVTVDHELVFQFYRVCSEVHNCTLSATPKLLQHAGAAAPCYQVLNVLTYALYDLAHLAAEELTNTISKAQASTMAFAVMAELNSLLPILTRADGMSQDNSSSFGALGVVLVKGVLAYILLRLGRSQDGLEVCAGDDVAVLVVYSAPAVNARGVGVACFPPHQRPQGRHLYVHC